MTWLEDRLDGKPVQKGCKTTVFTDESIRAAASGSFFKGLFQVLLAYFGANVGAS
jgi:hypothetical protein